MTDNRPDGRQGRHALLATDSTLSGVGAIAPYMLDAAGTDVMVITRDDIAVPLVQNGVAARTDMDATVRRLHDLFNRLAVPLHPELQDRLTPDALHAIARGIVTGDESSHGFDFDHDGHNDFGIVSMPDLTMGAAAAVGELTRIPPALLRNLPGDGADYRALVLLHEASHIHQPEDANQALYAEKPLPFEIDADHGALQSYDRAVRDGVPLDPAVPDTFREARVAGGFAVPGTLVEAIYGMAAGGPSGAGLPSHSTHWALGDHGLPADPTQGAQEAAAMMRVNMAVNGMMGAIGTVRMLRRYAETNRMSSDMERFFPDAAAMVLSVKDTAAMVMTGGVMAAENPVASLAVMQGLRDKNLFADDPQALQYMEKVEAFYDRHAPDYRNDTGYREYTETMRQIPAPQDAVTPARPVPDTPPRKTPPAAAP